ncbi:MAG TPA: phage baseplate assembly protein V [Myxococcaceae bacterium]|nr:phage baseplate assembly protein V [Myxococcaceae bacterium]
MSDSLNSPDRPSLGHLHGVFRATVTSVQDPKQQGRVQVKLYNAPPDASDADVGLWAWVAVPFAGGDRGALFLPDVDDEVAVTFIQGDPSQPIVIGGLWNGKDAPPDQPGGDRIDRYVVKARRGSQIAIIEESEGNAKITVSVPGNVSVKLDQSSSGSLTLEAAGNKIVLDSQGISIQGTQKIAMQAGQMEMKAGTIDVTAAISSFSAIVKAAVHQATSVIGTTYTPGAGNVW